MSEFTSPPVPEATDRDEPRPGQAVLIDEILGDFRAWLTQQPDLTAAAPVDSPVELDWTTLVGQFTALRQEVNLQTKSVRLQQEQGAQAIEQLRQAMETIKQQQAAIQQNEKNALEESQRPLLKTLIDLYDALSLAKREVERLAEFEEVDRESKEVFGDPRTEIAQDDSPPPTVTIALPFWARWFGGAAAVERGLAPLRAWEADRQLRRVEIPPPSPRDESEQDHDAEDPLDLLREKVDALLIGYDMGLQRLDRALQQHGLEPIPCVGEPFDPELMEVAEVVRDPHRQGTEVLDEVRRGYRWRGRLFRYAQVRVARPV
jgi:molecular chaperone GrpE